MAIDWASLDVDFNPTVTLLEMFKTFLGIADSAQDTALTMALNTAGPTLETYINNVIPKQECEDRYPHHFGTVTLDNSPVTDTAIVVVLDGVTQDNYSVYTSRGRMGHLTRTDSAQDVPMDWRKYEQAVVTYEAGYDALPVDLAWAIIYTAAPVFKSDGTGTTPGGATGDVKKQMITGVGSIEYDVGSSSGGGAIEAFGIIPETAAQLAQKYKRMNA